MGEIKEERKKERKLVRSLTLCLERVVLWGLLGDLLEHHDLGELLVEAVDDEGGVLLQLELVVGGDALGIDFNTRCLKWVNWVNTQISWGLARTRLDLLLGALPSV